MFRPYCHLLYVNNNPNATKFTTVPIDRYHSPSTATAISSFRAQGLFKPKAITPLRERFLTSFLDTDATDFYGKSFKKTSFFRVFREIRVQKKIFQT